jgi:hypothetical protein
MLHAPLRPAPRLSLVIAAVASLACAEAPVSAPVHALADAALHAKSTAAAGVYQLEFYNTQLQAVTSMAVGNGELVLGGHVEDVSGNDAQSGSVTFEYCSLKGGPPNDITRADEAPLEACANGSASWARLTSVAVNASGNAYMNFGVVMIPRTVGFRIKFSGRKSGIASGTSVPRNFTWVAAP